MANNLYGSICLSDIPKQYITTGKNGKKYIQVNIWENREPDRFGFTHAITVGLTQEQREKDVQKYYIGNLKGRGSSNNTQPAPAPRYNNDIFDDLP